ncbi:hypothetical protein KO516_06385 [Citreicella sp. C3M06]|uniref:hypothetical protein n=1 Tax=Citreicella sp. C3M06 TaxID=2841564 RepID=UPI001C095395|nr:hypothetical protein [Citreicella sp. C3M06]MBU2960446.1 hypothetical protein [Citreicella sp. C3M06]
MSGLLVMLGLGALAAIMSAAGMPLAPVVLGIVMGKIVEQTLMQSLISTQGDLLAFFDRPASMVLGCLTLALWGGVLIKAALRLWVRAAPRQAQ